MEDFKLEVYNVVRKLTLTVLTDPLSRHVHSAILKGASVSHLAKVKSVRSFQKR